MTVEYELQSSGLCIVEVGDRIDQNLTPILEETLLSLLSAGHNNLIIDLSQVSYINSGGLRSLVTAWREAGKQNGSVILCCINPRVAEVFKIVGFDRVFQIYTTRAEAEKAQGEK